MANYTFDKIEYSGNTYTITDSGALQLIGGNVTGSVSFGNSVSIDSLTAGNLVVNGAASFTNNLQANTINGISVGSSPNFTDEKVKIAAATNNATYYPIMGTGAGTATRQYSTYLKYKTDTKILVLDGEFRATKGIFKELIAAKGQISDLSVNNLTADTAIVTGLLDVKGELHTNKWTNANIANIGGSFYISPTVNTTITTGDPMSITFGGSANNRTLTISGGNFVTDAVKIRSGNSTSTASWSIGSRVMITGNIRAGTTGVDYPLGTIEGYLTAVLTSSGFAVGEVNSLALEAIISQIGTSNIKSYNLSISMLEIGPKTALKPVGIMMTSYGVDKSTYLDIYRGVNQKNSSTNKVDPNLRIGYLGGLSSYTDSAGNTHQPVGWGIYTDNGFFKGTIVADSGSIGKFTIDASAIKTGTIGALNGILISPDNTTSYTINGGSRTNLRLAIGTKFGVDNNGVLYADGANITNINASSISTGTLSADRIGATSITAGKLNVSTLSAITADMGTITAGVIKHDTVGGTNGIWFSAATDTSSNVTVHNSGARKDWRLLVNKTFGVTKDGALYATNASVSGAITASSLTITSGSTTYDGVTAINATGYTIEIINDASKLTGVHDLDVETYLYPILYLNGVAVTVSDKTNFIWYESDSSIAHQGDATYGGITATYGNTYRVIYQINDGEVASVTPITTITVDPSTYITRIGSNGIRIHPENQSGTYSILMNANHFTVQWNS